MVLILLISASAKAQVSLVHQALAKLESCNSYSYQSVTKIKEYYTTDTITEQHHAIFEKAPTDQQLGYLFRIRTLNENNGSTYTEFYNGRQLIFLTPADSTYQLQDIQHFNSLSTLTGSLKWILERLKKNSSSITNVRDTTIEGKGNYHLIATVFDTIIDKERNYNVVNMFMDKASGMPTLMIIKARYTTFGNGVSIYYSSALYLNLNLRTTTPNLTLTTIPTGFHVLRSAPAISKELSGPLLQGSLAPDWTLRCILTPYLLATPEPSSATNKG